MGCFRKQTRGVDPGLFVWVDECGTQTSMTHLYARAPKGERAYGSVPRNRGKNTTLIASMTPNEGLGEDEPALGQALRCRREQER